jgi:uncharacterized protein with NRDE domain
MCTIAILIDIVAGAPLVLAANRDEMYARPTRSPEVLVETPRVVGGVDELSGGTWLAVRGDAQFAAVTNQRALAPQVPAARSRGLIVRELATSHDPAGEIARLDPTRYASMNLVWGKPGHVQAVYSRRDPASVEIEPLGRGIHVLCNDRLGSPGFPRGERLRDGIAQAIDAGVGWPAIAGRIAVLLGYHTKLPLEAVHATHLPREIERELTATCIHTPAYGTRSSTIVALAPGRVVGYVHADGPPGETPFVDRMELFG